MARGNKRTSIGRSANSRPKGKNQRRQYKRYHGQGPTRQRHKK